MPDGHFKFGVIEDPGKQAKLLAEIYRLRYQVYVREWGFEDPADHPSGVETDAFDRHALHFYARPRDSEELIGTARIILASDLGFPIERHFVFDRVSGKIPVDKIGEISRLSISKAYRRREIDQVIFGRGMGDLEILRRHDLAARDLEDERRKCEHELIRGIYLLIYRESLRLDLTHWYAVMAKGLQVILRRWGIPFEQIGPEIEHHGIRAPYVLSISELESHLQRKNPGLLKLAREKVAGK